MQTVSLLKVTIFKKKLCFNETMDKVQLECGGGGCGGGVVVVVVVVVEVVVVVGV